MPLTKAKGLSKVLCAFCAPTTRLNFSLVLLDALRPLIAFHTIHILNAFSAFQFYPSFIALNTKDAIISLLLIIVFINYKVRSIVIFVRIPCYYLSFVRHSFLPSFRRTSNFLFPGLLQPDGAGPEPVNLEDDQDFEDYKPFENDDQPKEEGKE